MKKTVFFTVLIPLLLAGCASGETSALPGRGALLQNPLYAEQYWAEVVDRMASLQINEDPLLEDPDKAAVVNEVKLDALQRAEDARALIRQGLSADFLDASEPLDGSALLLEGTLWLSPDFLSYPGATLRIYLTEAVDPRDVDFPDETSLDLGPLLTPYGAQEYVLPEDKRSVNYRTVVLWDRRLERLYGFAQLGR